MFLLRGLFFVSLVQWVLVDAFGFDEILKHAFKLQEPFLEDMENISDRMMPMPMPSLDDDMKGGAAMPMPDFGNLSTMAQAEVKDMKSSIMENMSRMENTLFGGIGSMEKSLEGGFGDMLQNVSSSLGGKVMEISKEAVTEMSRNGNRTREVSMSDACVCEQACDETGSNCKLECKENGKVVESCKGLKAEELPMPAGAMPAEAMPAGAVPAQAKPSAQDFRRLSGKQFLARTDTGNPQISV